MGVCSALDGVVKLEQIVEAYGVWGEKVFMGRKYMGAHRVTFLIGPDGKIKKNLAEGEAGGTCRRSPDGALTQVAGAIAI